MKSVFAAMALIIFAAAPVPAATSTAHAAAETGHGKDSGVQMHQMQMRHPPQQLLMTAHHRNVANFGQVLYLAAEEGETVPAPLARSAVAEMRRSIEEMEKQRALAPKEAPVNPEHQKVMDEHLVQVKMQLRQLEDLVKKDRIDSGEVRKHLQAVFEECEGAGCEMIPEQTHGRHPGWEGHPDAQHGAMMQKMMQRVKRQDWELAALVREMTGASREARVDLLVEVVSRMVRQRAELTAEMERMMRRHAGMSHGMFPVDYDDEQGYEEELDDD